MCRSMYMYVYSVPVNYNCMYTVEPLYCGHHWDPITVLISGVGFHYVYLIMHMYMYTLAIIRGGGGGVGVYTQLKCMDSHSSMESYQYMYVQGWLTFEVLWSAISYHSRFYF